MSYFFFLPSFICLEIRISIQFNNKFFSLIDVNMWFRSSFHIFLSCLFLCFEFNSKINFVIYMRVSCWGAIEDQKKIMEKRQKFHRQSVDIPMNPFRILFSTWTEFPFRFHSMNLFHFLFSVSFFGWPFFPRIILDFSLLKSSFRPGSVMRLKWFLFFFSLSVAYHCQVGRNWLKLWTFKQQANFFLDFEQFYRCSRTEHGEWNENKRNFSKRNTINKYNFVLRCWLLIRMLLFATWFVLKLYLCHAFVCQCLVQWNSFIRLFLLLLLSLFFFNFFFFNCCVNIKRIKCEFFPFFSFNFLRTFYFALGVQNIKSEKDRVGERDHRKMVFWSSLLHLNLYTEICDANPEWRQFCDTHESSYC